MNMSLLPSGDTGLLSLPPLRCLEAKFIVDFANGIDVAADHIRVQRASGDIFQRLLAGFTGASARRQAEVNASLADGVAGSLAWLAELTEQHAFSNLALASVNDRVNQIKVAVASVADYSVESRKRIDQLAVLVEQHHQLVADRLQRIELRLEAIEQRDAIFQAWGAGRFAGFSLLGRCYMVLEELHWGLFGDYYRSLPDDARRSVGADLANRAIRQLMIDASCAESARIGIHEWTSLPADDPFGQVASQVLAYLGDGCDADRTPFAYMVSHVPAEIPLEVPRLCTVVRATEALIDDVFEGRHG